MTNPLNPADDHKSIYLDACRNISSPSTKAR